MPHKLDHPEKEKIIEMILAKEQWSIIEDVCDCSSGTITKYRKEIGIKKQEPKLLEQDKLDIVKARSKVSLKKLANSYRVTASYISKICNPK